MLEYRWKIFLAVAVETGISYQRNYNEVWTGNYQSSSRKKKEELHGILAVTLTVVCIKH